MSKRTAGWITLIVLAAGMTLITAAPVAGQATTAPAETDQPPGVSAAPAGGPAAPAPAPAPAPAEQPKKPGGLFGGDPWMLFLMMGVIVLVFFGLGRKPKKEEHRRKEMLANLKKGDRITTIGGVVGTITDIRENEIVLKVDEASNTRVRFARWAIRQVGEDKPAEEKK